MAEVVKSDLEVDYRMTGAGDDLISTNLRVSPFHLSPFHFKIPSTFSMSSTLNKFQVVGINLNQGMRGNFDMTSHPTFAWYQHVLLPLPIDLAR